MKNFFNFLSEAKESQASIQARRMGLKGDGHGGWYNTQGEFVAKTVGGELKFYTKGQKPGEKDTPNQKPQASQQVAPVQAKVAPTQQKSAKQPEQQSERPEVENPQSVTVVLGRFNPPVKDHQKLFNSAYNLVAGGEFRIYPSRTQDPKKNPLDPDTKIEYMKMMFPKYEENIINSEDVVNVFDVLQSLEEDGFTDVTIVVGSDRLGEFKNLSNKYNGSMYNFDNINVVSVGKDSDGETAEGRVRQAISSNDYATFKSLIPKELEEKKVKSLFSILKKSMGGVSEQWEIDPKSDWKGLRENYITKKIFNVGDIVESLNTGLVGEIIRRGTNYLICVTEEDIMFKSWIYDVKEWTEVSGVPADQREVGTDAFREYTMKMTDLKKIKNFINKYKAKSSK
jgi:nicotinic acid mononucleotide adenylyltransferase